MSEGSLPDERVQEILDRSGVDAESGAITRRAWPRFETAGDVTFNRPGEQTRHTGELADISDGGLAFVTDLSLAVGETLHLTYQEAGASVSAEAKVETVHSHPKEDRFLVGVKFVA